ncbi:hypothetical protein M422DRAFT_266075 [Sphaerobolus stellatus SS14]|uniref:NADH dehydrogenase [ubiquinone] 1 alpha subcomplex subunit n=1 Tax=Sphaerobolus stellatus (strain SS14) TaxID=990650 RepID=A0A0C9UBV7_SPHS4|nr:hypothetical protein M422DRAFT_266075 [Sphaerobolus stellatus SS14]
MSSPWARIWSTVRSRATRRLVGRDLEGEQILFSRFIDPSTKESCIGNRFYESFTGTGERPRRTVEFTAGKDAWIAATKLPHLPAQWSAWLSHGRAQPPTLEELHKDLLRMSKLAQNVARLKQQDEEEIQRQALARQRDITGIQSPSHSTINQSESAATAESSQSPTAVEPVAPSSRPIGPTAEPQPWSPQAAQRGQPDHSDSQSSTTANPAAPPPRPIGATAEPQSWTPQSARRG